MVLKGDSGPTMESEGMFELKQVNSSKQMKKIIDQTPDTVAESDEEEEIKSKYLRYTKDEQHLSSSGLYYKDSDSELEMESESEDEADIKEGLGLSDSENEEETKKKPKPKTGKHPLITDLDHRTKEEKKVHKAEMWFERDVFKDLIDEKDEDADLDRMVNEIKKKGAKVIGEEEQDENKAETDSDYSSDDSDYNDFEKLAPKNNVKKDGFEIVAGGQKVGKKRKYKLTEEELALGTLMVNSKKSKRDIIDAAWNRYAFNDDNLPDWFIQDEQKHMKKEAALPKVCFNFKYITNVLLTEFF